MKALRLFVLSSCVWVGSSTLAQAEGFAQTEWSARGTSLAGGLVARADDPSAIAYNAAGITQLPGTQFMGGFAINSSSSDIDTLTKDGKSRHNKTKGNILPMPQFYISHQLNDQIWLGFGIFSRFGLRNEYSGTWAGRYNVTDISMQTFSAVPTIAFKVNDMLSVSAGVEVVYGLYNEKSQVPSLKTIGYVISKGPDSNMKLDASGWGFGAQLGAHLRMNDQWSLGLIYKSKINLRLHGDASFGRQTSNLLAEKGEVPHTIDTNIHSTITLPSSLSLGLSYKPFDNLSFEVGTVWTRWSDFKSLDFYFDSDFKDGNPKSWDDGWNFNASVEYSPLSWLTLRGGVWYETSVVDSSYADFMVPYNGRTAMTLGAGFKWDNWTLDIAYAHHWIRSLDYNSTNASGISDSVGNLAEGKSHNNTNIYSVTISYKF